MQILIQTGEKQLNQSFYSVMLADGKDTIYNVWLVHESSERYPVGLYVMKARRFRQRKDRVSFYALELENQEEVAFGWKSSVIGTNPYARVQWWEKTFIPNIDTEFPKLLERIAASKKRAASRAAA